jgi:glutamate synthase (NADPH) large chain
MNDKRHIGLPPSQGLYDPANEKDSCGVGFVCSIKGKPSRKIIEDAQAMNCCMEHRGGVGYEQNTGDGAGIMVGMPDGFLRRVAREDLGVTLPAAGLYGVANVFLPHDPAERAHCKRTVEAAIDYAGQTLLGWRALPTHPDGAGIGNAARAAMPHFEQLFIAAKDVAGEDFERKLYQIRKSASNILRRDGALAEAKRF